MVEEALYDQVETGDPDPLGLRKKLAASKGASDPLGLRAKLMTAKEPAKAAVPEAQPEFKPATNWLNIPQEGYQPIAPENQVNEHTVKVSESSARIKDHLADIDKSVHNLIYEKKKDVLGREKSQELGLNPSENGPINFQTQQLAQKDKQDVYVSPVEVESFKEGMGQNQVMMRQGLAQKAKDLAKTDPAQASLLKGDVYRLDRQNDPSKDKKISSNIEKINKGELDYDVTRGILTKPVSFLGGIVEGFKEKNKAFEDYGVYSSGNEDDIIKHLNKKVTADPDEPTVVGKEGFANVLPGGDAGMMVGGQPLKPIAGGLVAGMVGGPQAGTAAMGLISAPEMYKLGYANALPQNYAAIKKQNPDISDVDAYHKASELADKQASVDAATGMAMGLLGGEFAFKPTGLSTGLLQKSVGSALKQLGEAGAKKGLEGLGVGAIGATGQVVKNLMAQKVGLPVDEITGVADQLKSGVAMTLGMTIAAKSANLLKPSTYNKLFQGLSKIPSEAIRKELSNLQQTGHITPEEAQKVQVAIDEHKKLDSQIPDNIPESDRLKVQAKIKERDALEASMETAHKAYHPEIKEQIKKLDEDIVNISKGAERGDLQKMVDKEHKAGNVQGFVTETLRDASEQDLKGYFKEIAEQAHDPNSEATTIATFGNEIVNKAKELYPKEEPQITVGELLDKEGSYKGQKGTFYQDGQTVVFKVKGGNREYEIGNINDVQDRPIKDFGIEHETSVVGINDNGEISVRGSVYKNNYSDPLMAINRDKNGNVVSVNLETPDGKKRTFRGDIAEDIAYNIHLKEITKNNETRTAFEDFINSDEPTKQQIEAGGLSGATKEGANENNQQVQREKINTETTTIKPQDNAIPEQISNEVDVRQQAGNGESLGERDTQPEIPAGQEIGGQPKEEGTPSGQEKVIDLGEEMKKVASDWITDQPREVGITHRQMDAMAEELGLPIYEKSPEKVTEWDQQAAEKLQQPEALNNLFNKLRNGELPDHVETRMMLQYMGDIAAKIEKDPYNRDLQDQMLRTKDLFNIAGRLQGKGLAARKGSIPVEETLSDFLIRDRETNKAPLTDEQITVSKKEFEDMKAAKDAFEAKMASDKEMAAKSKAEKAVQEEAKTAKKQPKKDYTNEREKIFADIKEKLRKARGDTNIVIVPYAKELIAIAPDVMKLVKNYIDQGISELPELVRRVQEVLKDDIPHITEKDVHNIIAGEYNQKKQTRSQLAQQVYDLRKEASLVNELEDLQNGQIPVSKNKQRQRNQKIEVLRQKIKDLKDDIGLNDKTEAEKLSALKARYKSQIFDLEKKIAAGDYGPDTKPEPIVLDKEAIDLKDKMIKLKLDREARLAKQEYDNRNNIQKAKDLGADALDAVRTLQTNPDLSFFGRQGIKFLVTHPIKGPKVFWESARQAISQKRYDRWLFDMHNSPAWKLIEDSGLAVLDPNTLHASQREEQWRSQLIHKIPVAGQVAKASERAFTSAANMARVDWFMEGVDILRKQGKTWENSPEEYKGWASAVNNMTGRGGLGKLEPVVGQLAIPFWSPRLIAANVNLFLNPRYYTKMPKTARIMLIKNMAQYVVTGAAFLGAANLLGAETETDPRSSDFGKIKVGNKRYDIWGGAAQYIRVLSQLMTASRKSSGSVSELKPRQMVTTGTNLVRTKLSPIWGFAIDAKLGENVVGEKVEWKDAYKLMIPMLWNDIQDAKKDSGPEAGAVVGLLSFLGIGAQTYGGSNGGTSASSNGKPGKPSKPSKPSK